MTCRLVEIYELQKCAPSNPNMVGIKKISETENMKQMERQNKKKQQI